MTIYLVVLEDRHSDVQIQCFAALVPAITRAKEITEHYRQQDNEPEETTEETGWHYSAVLTGEGDYIHVEEADLQEE